MRKSRVSVALGAVLGAAALAPATSFGWSVDTANGTLLTDSGGDTLLFPLYTAAGEAGSPAKTSFSVTNTSTTQTILTKIRFREQTRSMDVLDFYVVLSPADKFDFVAKAGDPRPVMVWNDNSCLVGPGSAGQVMFPAPSAFVDPLTGDQDMTVGHLEMLGVADLTGVCANPDGSFNSSATPCPTGTIDLAAAAKHDSTGVPPNCGIFINMLGSAVTTATYNGQTAAGNDVDNVLVGRYLVTVDGQGIEAGGDAIAIQDSNLGPPALPIPAQTSEPCGAGPNCTTTHAWDQLNWDHPHLGEMANLANFQTALTANFIGGDWSNNPSNLVGVDWVLSFPTKYVYLDLVDASTCAGGLATGTEWCLLAADPAGNGTSNLWTAADTANLCLVNNQVRGFDTEEQESTGDVTVSPGSNPTLDLCDELEVFTLAAPGQAVRDSVIQSPDRRRVIGLENLDAIRGWGLMDLSWNTVGDAVTGLLVTTRNTDDPTINNGSITSLQKEP